MKNLNNNHVLITQYALKSGIHVSKNNNETLMYILIEHKILPYDQIQAQVQPCIYGNHFNELPSK